MRPNVGPARHTPFAHRAHPVDLTGGEADGNQRTKNIVDGAISSETGVPRAEGSTSHHYMVAALIGTQGVGGGKAF